MFKSVLHINSSRFVEFLPKLPSLPNAGRLEFGDEEEKNAEVEIKKEKKI